MGKGIEYIEWIVLGAIIAVGVTFIVFVFGDRVLNFWGELTRIAMVSIAAFIKDIGWSLIT